jgi:hypothetical protein
VFSGSDFGSGGDGINDFFVVLIGLGEVNGGLLEDVFVFRNGKFGNSDGVGGLLNLFVQRGNGLVTNGFISSIFSIGFVLIILNLF